MEASLRLAARMLESVGAPAEAVSLAIAQQRECELAKLELQTGASPRRVRPVRGG